MNATKETIADDLVISTQTPRLGLPGVWVAGTIAGHRFEVLVFPSGDADTGCPDFELGEGRISKLWLERIADKQCVANFDWGWDTPPKTDDAQAIVDFLAAGLAEHVFGG